MDGVEDIDGRPQHGCHEDGGRANWFLGRTI
jgi:hypothetical protein